MGTHWLLQQLTKSKNLKYDSDSEIITVHLSNKTEKVYYPNPDEYRVTADVVRKAYDLGATLIVYSESWCGVTHEGKAYASTLNVNIMKNAAFFAYLKRKGIEFSE